MYCVAMGSIKRAAWWVQGWASGESEPLSSFPGNLKSRLRDFIVSVVSLRTEFINSGSESDDICPTICGGKKARIKLEKKEKRRE